MHDDIKDERAQTSDADCHYERKERRYERRAGVQPGLALNLHWAFLAVDPTTCAVRQQFVGPGINSADASSIPAAQ
jgi:hypothetical protein